jgi:hypothetical protein
MNTFLPDANAASQKYPMINPRYQDSEQDITAFQAFLNLQNNPSMLFTDHIDNDPNELIMAKLKWM